MLVKGRIVDVDSGMGIEGVLVSNGEEVVRTGHEGCYKLRADPGIHRFIFITVPEGYRPLESFFISAEKWGSGRIDFRLVPAPERLKTPFTVAHVTDTHLGRISPEWLLEDLERISREAEADLVIASGDLTSRGEPEQLKLLSEIIKGLEIPVFPLFGGHDGNAERRAGRLGETFTRNWERWIGPAYYSFDWGGHHFILYPSEDHFFSPEDQRMKKNWLPP